MPQFYYPAITSIHSSVTTNNKIVEMRAKEYSTNNGWNFFVLINQDKTSFVHKNKPQIHRRINHTTSICKKLQNTRFRSIYSNNRFALTWTWFTEKILFISSFLHNWFFNVSDYHRNIWQLHSILQCFYSLPI